jgi:hypothetical protein
MSANNDSNVQSNRKRLATCTLKTSKVVKPDDEQLIKNETSHNQLSNADPIIQIFKS